MNQNLYTAAALLTVALTSACGTPDILQSADVGTPIRTDSAVYHVRTTEYFHDLTIEATYTNLTGKTVYIPGCHSPDPPVLEKWQEDKWVTAYAPVVLLCLGSPVIIGAGDVYAYTYRISAARTPNTSPRFEVAELPGTYRLVWRILSTWTPHGPEPGLGKELPLEQRISNTFEIVR